MSMESVYPEISAWVIFPDATSINSLKIRFPASGSDSVPSITSPT